MRKRITSALATISSLMVSLQDAPIAIALAACPEPLASSSDLEDLLGILESTRIDVARCGLTEATNVDAALVLMGALVRRYRRRLEQLQRALIEHRDSFRGVGAALDIATDSGQRYARIFAALGYLHEVMGVADGVLEGLPRLRTVDQLLGRIGAPAAPELRELRDQLARYRGTVREVTELFGPVYASSLELMPRADTPARRRVWG